MTDSNVTMSTKRGKRVAAKAKRRKKTDAHGRVHVKGYTRKLPSK